MSLHKATKIIIDIMFAVCLVCVVIMPFVPASFFAFINIDSHIAAVKALLMVTGLLGAGILAILHLLYVSMLKGSPFTRHNAALLGRMGVLGLLIAAGYGAKMFFLPSFGTLMVVVVFVLCFLFCLTLRDLFLRAAGYKEENDLTI